MKSKSDIYIVFVWAPKWWWWLLLHVIDANACYYEPHTKRDQKRSRYQTLSHVHPIFIHFFRKLDWHSRLKWDLFFAWIEFYAKLEYMYQSLAISFIAREWKRFDDIFMYLTFWLICRSLSCRQQQRTHISHDAHGDIVANIYINRNWDAYRTVSISRFQLFNGTSFWMKNDWNEL